jgi:hypothetical protein
MFYGVVRLFPPPYRFFCCVFGRFSIRGTQKRDKKKTRRTSKTNKVRTYIGWGFSPFFFCRPLHTQIPAYSRLSELNAKAKLLALFPPTRRSLPTKCRGPARLAQRVGLSCWARWFSCWACWFSCWAQPAGSAGAGPEIVVSALFYRIFRPLSLTFLLRCLLEEM